MTVNSGTATDYLDLLDQLIEVVTSRHLDTIAINAAGTGYVAGDVLGITNTGSTRTHDAQIEVVTVGGGGSISTARIYRGGAYTVDPSTVTGNAATGGTGTGATFNLTFAPTGWTELARESVAVSATVAAGGTGYSVGNDLTLVGGVLAPGGSPATFNVDSVSSGAVTAVSMLTAGDYEVYPTNAVLTSVSPAGGLGCTLNVTWADKSGDTIVVLRGDAGASLDPFVGIKTYSNETDETGGNTVYNWALFAFPTWSSLAALHNQANVSDGFAVAGDGTLTTSSSGDGAFVPLKAADAFDINWWIFATGRRVHLIARVEGASTTHYAHASFGLLNPFGISTELPWPGYVAGSSDRKRVWYRDTSSIFGGLSDVIQRANGPFFCWAPEGVWLNMNCAVLASNQATTPSYNQGNVTPRTAVWPLGSSNVHSDSNDQIWQLAPSAGFDTLDITPAAGATEIYRTPNSGGDLFPLYPVTLVQHDSATGFFRALGELDGVFWFHLGGSGASSEDRITQGGLAFTVFQNGTRVQPYSFLVIQED